MKEKKKLAELDETKIEVAKIFKTALNFLR